MSMSLRDQLLAAGLVSQKQVREAERQQQQQERAQQQSRQKRPPGRHEQATKKPGHAAPADRASGQALPGNATPSAAAASDRKGPAIGGAIPNAAARHAAAQSAKVARDLALNKKQQEKAQQRARAAQIKQLIEQNRLPRAESDERYNFIDGGRIRFIAANVDIRRRLISGDLFIVRHDGMYDVVPAAIAQRIRERDQHAVIKAAAADTTQTPPVDDAYKDFAVPDDLMW
jgi:uncharacterized protein YaiL (DUF2058 family)